MRRSSFLILSAAVALGCSDSPSGPPDTSVPLGIWGSGEASLTLTDTTSTLKILRSGCVGAYGTISQPIMPGGFALPGIYTELIGAAPGKREYAAQFSGTVEDRQMSITITVPSLQQDFGPYTLTYGVSNDWTMCLYP